MDISPELEKSVKSQLSRFFNNPESERFLDLRNAVNSIQETQPPWEAFASIGVYASSAFADREKENNTKLLQELIDQTFGSIDRLFKSNLLNDLEPSFNDEKMRLLFYVRFALGFLLLAKDDKVQSKQILHDMVAMKVTATRQPYSVEEGTMTQNSINDISAGKLHTFLYLLPVYAQQEDWLENLFNLNECITCAPWAKPLLILGPIFLDGWIKDVSEQDNDRPGLEWLWLFVEAGELLLLNRENDSAATPSECKKDSVQYLSWKIGQIIGKFALNWYDDPFDHFKSYESVVGEKDTSLKEERKRLKRL